MHEPSHPDIFGQLGPVRGILPQQNFHNIKLLLTPDNHRDYQLMLCDKQVVDLMQQILNFGDRLSNVLLQGACVVELRCFIMIILIFFVFQLL